MEGELLSARVRDAVRLSDNSQMPKFVGFLSSAEAAEAESTARKLNADFEFFGGYEGAERVYFGVFPDWCEDRQSFLPFCGITFRYRTQDKLAHRDFLGALMSLGITRESVGDILVEDGRCVAFISKDVAEHVCRNIDKVGRVGVSITEGADYPLPEVSGFKELSDTIASARLDCVVASLVPCSRARAAELIEEGTVSIDSVAVLKPTREVRADDKITVRRVGKFVIESIDERTRKNRIILKAKKYI